MWELIGMGRKGFKWVRGYWNCVDSIEWVWNIGDGFEGLGWMERAPDWA